MHLRTAVATTRGARKRANEDSCCILQAQSSLGPLCLVVVCDGVGGLAAGEVASTHVAHQFVRWFENDLPGYLSRNSVDGTVDVVGIERPWRELLRKANARITEYGSKNNARMGTTVSALFICQNRAFTCQVGDSRIYRLRQGKLAALTKDQTLVEREVETGLLTPEEAANSPKRSVILQAVGSQAKLAPVFNSYDVTDGDAFAVCCDGFYHTIENRELIALLDACSHAVDEEMSALLEAALQERMDRGETDNITVACCVNSHPYAEFADDESTGVLSADDVTELLTAEFEVIARDGFASEKADHSSSRYDDDETMALADDSATGELVEEMPTVASLRGGGSSDDTITALLPDDGSTAEVAQSDGDVR